MDFYQTPLGRKFFEAQVPQLIKSLNRVADGMNGNQIQGFSSKLSEGTKARLIAIMDDSGKAEAFAKALMNEMASDDEKLSRKGRYLAKAILDNNTDDLLLAICGWSSESLMNITEYGAAHTKKEPEQESSDIKMDGMT